MEDKTKINTEGLDKLIKALGGKLPMVRIGILGKDDAREGASSNATIGARHEFGTEGMARRSFLRVPLTDHLEKDLDNKGAFDKDVLKAVVKSGTIIPWLKKMSIVAENIVREAFASGGYGKWKPWKNKNYTNNTGMILVDTTQLRDSIDSEIK